MAELIRNDGVLIDAYNQYGNGGNPIVNHTTGLGTNRDKSTHGTVGDVAFLNRYDANILYRGSKLVQKLVDLLPQDSTKKWGRITLGEGDEVPDFSDYEMRLNLRNAIARAAIAGRLTGDGFVAMGIDDGLMWDEPVNEAGIKSISWLKVLNRHDLQPVYGRGGYEDPEYFRFTIDKNRWPGEEIPWKIHKSRVLRIPGTLLPEDILRDTSGYNDSVLIATFQAFRQYMSGMGSSAGMLADYSVFVYGLSGLSDMLSSVDEESAKETKDALLNRFLAIQMGMSTVKGLILDAENESASFISRNYGGVDQILDRLLELLVANSGMPRTKLLGSSNTGAFSEGGLSDRYEWADCISGYQCLFLTQPVKQIYRYLFLAADSPTKGALPAAWDFEWAETLQLTKLEQAQLEETLGKADMLALRNGTLHPREVRESRYGGQQFGLTITIDPELTDELMKKPEPPPALMTQGKAATPAAAPVDTEDDDEEEGDEETKPPVSQQKKATKTQQRADADTLALLRKDALDGLIPLETYWQSAGLNPAEQRKLMEQQRERSRAGYWEADY
jgi:phage-related protein (TIGR01555 family)